MDFSNQDVEIMEEAFPDLKIDEVYLAVQNPLKRQEAQKIVAINRYTRYCVEDIMGLHLHCFSDETYHPAPIDLEKADLFYHTHIYKDNFYTIAGICLRNQNFEQMNRCLDYMEAKNYTPEQIEKALFLESVKDDVRGFLLLLPEEYIKTAKNESLETLLKNKKDLDCCLARIAKHIGARKLLSEIFKDNISPDFKLNEPAPFKGPKKAPLYPLDLLVKYRMPRFSIELLKQAAQQSKSQDFLLEMANGQYMHQAMNQVYKNVPEADPYKKQIYDYFESLISTDLFIEYVSQKKLNTNWRQDFTYDPKETPPSEINVSEESKDTKVQDLKNKPLTQKEKQAMQLDFMQQLFSPYMK